MSLSRVLVCLALCFASLQAQQPPSDLQGEYALLPESLHPAYLKKRPEGFLSDPQQLLRPHEARQRREFLEYHSGDSLIDLHVVLLKGDQSLPGIGLEERFEHWYGAGKPAVIVQYYMGRPERAEMHLTGKLGMVPMDERARVLESAIERAKTGLSPLEELEKFMVQVASRIIRMESLLGDEAANATPKVDEAESANERESEGAALSTQLKAFWGIHKLKLIGAVVLLALAWWLRRWIRQRATYHFPESDAEERLGGAHGAGVGAIIHFGKTSLPAAAQLEKLKLH